jgi:hypothetical protein
MSLGIAHADRGQIDRATPALGSHHRGDRRGGIPAGSQLVAVECDVGTGADFLLFRQRLY